MGKGKIFLVGETEEKLTPMEETPFAAEDILQLLIEKYPDLIPGDQIDPENPRRWILVQREMGVPSREGGSDVWSLDHLLLDQDGVPTFVECKRAIDTRIRREVVAQMLDYAANGTQHWPAERIRQAASESPGAGKSLDSRIMELLGTDDPGVIEGYWERVHENLRKGRVRLLFVADAIPKELRRLVEFLNEKMEDVEVLAIEVKQFLGANGKAVVPRVIGMTESGREKKPTVYGERVTAESFLEKIPPEKRQPFQTLLELAGDHGYSIYHGFREITLGLLKKADGQRVSLFYLRPAGNITFTLRADIGIPEKYLGEIEKYLSGLRLFRVRGSSFMAPVTAENAEGLSRAFERVFQKLEEVRSGLFE